MVAAGRPVVSLFVSYLTIACELLVGRMISYLDIAVVCGRSYRSVYLAEFVWERSVGHHDLVDITVVSSSSVICTVGGRGRITLPRRDVLFL